MAKQMIVDRIEGNIVVVELNGDLLELPLQLFSSKPKEGDQINLSIEISTPSSTEAVDRLERLKQRDCGSDTIDL